MRLSIEYYSSGDIPDYAIEAANGIDKQGWRICLYDRESGRLLSRGPFVYGSYKTARTHARSLMLDNPGQYVCEQVAYDLPESLMTIPA